MTKTKWLSLYRLRQPSFLLILLPYLSFNWKEFLHSPFYSTTGVVLFLLIVLAIDLLLKSLHLSTTKISKAWMILIISTSIVFFYGYYFLSDLQEFTLKVGKIPVRMRTIFISLFVIVLFIQFA